MKEVGQEVQVVAVEVQVLQVVLHRVQVDPRRKYFEGQVHAPLERIYPFKQEVQAVALVQAPQLLEQAEQIF